MNWSVELARAAKSLVFGPGVILILLIAAYLFTYSKSKPRRTRALILATSGLCLFYFSSCTPLALLHHLEGKSNRLAQEAQNSGCLNEFETIVILGGGVSDQHRIPNISSQVRIHHGIKLLKELVISGRQRHIIMSSGPNDDAQAFKNGIATELASNSLAHEVIFETASLNTYQNGVFSSAVITQRGLPKRVILVTSSYHMTRSVAVFRKLGLRVCPSPAPAAEFEGLTWLSFDNASLTYLALNEFFGVFGYWLKGWV